MKPKYWEELDQIVSDALEVDVSERRKFIAERCAGSTELLREVESLLESETEAENLFDAPAIVDYADFLDADEEPNVLAGEEIGNYRVVREIGYGGMGAVYLAERADGKFTQKIALKLLKREMNTAALRRRFQQEQAILASLEHPNIARLLDAGATRDGIPFLAMEYVEGLPIDDYCNQNELDLSQRLDLFRKVCTAVNFAHRNLIVHRDLKPSNILVNEDGIPKLLDFGISKILSSEFEQVNSATVTKLGAMTPGYASPEQITGKSVTTATDIYSLGVILYELLSGHRPFETKETDFKEIYKAVLEDEPFPPSAMIETAKSFREKTETKTVARPISNYNAETPDVLSDNQTEAEKSRSTISNAVSYGSSNLRGDLDNIVLKALRKETERRYTSAESLAEDIHRHQRGLPVSARPNTFSYRAEKFIKRNKASVVAGILVILAIVVGLIATLWQAKIAAAERDHAQAEAKKARKVNEYTKSILNFSNPAWVSSNPKRNRDAKISDAMDEALKNIDSELADEPEIQAEILLTISQTYTSQGQIEKAEKLLRRSIEKFDQVLGGGNLKSMQASIVLADTLYLSGKLNEAEKLYSRGIDFFKVESAKDKSQIKWLAIALIDLANVVRQTANTRKRKIYCFKVLT